MKHRSGLLRNFGSWHLRSSEDFPVSLQVKDDTNNVVEICIQSNLY